VSAVANTITIPIEIKSDGSVVLKDLAQNLQNVQTQGDAAKRSAGGFVDQLVQGFGQGIGQKLFTAVVDGAKAVPAALYGAAKATIDYGGNLIDTAARTGIAVEAQQELAFAGSLVGVSFGQIDGANRVMQRGLVETPEVFDRIGLSASTLREMEAPEQFEAIANQLAGIKDPAERSAAAIALFGKSGQQLLPLLNEDLGETMERAQELGLVMSKDVAGAADDLGDSVDTLMQVFQGLERNVGAVFVTSEPLHVLMEGLIEIFSALSSEVNANQSSLRDLVDSGVLIVAYALAGLVQATTYVLDAWSGLKIMGIALGASFEMLGAKAVTLWDVLSGEIGITEARNRLKQQEADITKRTNEEIEAELVKNGQRHDVLDRVNESMGTLVAKITDAQGKTHQAAQETERSNRVHLGAKDAAKQHAEAMKYLATGVAAFFDEIGKRREARENVMGLLGPSIQDATIEMGRLTDSFDRNTKAGDLSDAMLKNYIESMEEQVELGGENADAQEALADAYEMASDRGVLAGKALKEYEENLKRVPPVVDSAAAAFKRMWDEANSFEGITDGIVAGLREIGGEIGRMGDGLAGGFDAVEKLSSATTWAGVVQGVSGVVSGFKTATDSASGMMRAMGGAAMGAKLGNEFAGPWGAAIGGAIGAIAGLLRGKPAWAKAGEEAGKIFGHEVSRELAETILADSKDLGISVANASLLHITDAMDEGKGAARDYADEVMKLMAGIHDGSIPAAEGLDQVGEMFGRIKDEAIDAGRVGARELVGILQAARETGTMTDDMKAFVQERIDLAIGGMQRFAAGLAKMDGAWEGSGVQAAGLFMTTFNAAMAEKGLVAAVDALQPAFESLREKFGEVGDDSALAMLGPFSRLSDMLNAEDGVFRGATEMAAGLDDVLKGLADSGYLTADAFDNIQAHALTAYTVMTEAGATPNEALMAMLPTLQDIVSASQEYGFELDANTQALVDQAKAAGYAFPPEPQRVMIDLLSEIVKLMGGDLPESARRASDGFRETGAAATDVFTQIEGDVDRLSGIEINIPVTYQQRVEGSGPEGGGDMGNAEVSGGGGGGGRRANRLAMGGVILPRPGGTFANIAEAGKAEVVAPVDYLFGQLADRIVQGVAGAGGGGQGGPIVVQLNVAGHVLDQIIVERTRAGFIALPNQGG
jgi:hypothetical protein